MSGPDQPARLAITVRDAVPDDAAGLVSVLNPIIEARCYTVLDRPFTVEAERAFVEQFPRRGVFHVAVDETDGAVVGFQNVEPFAAFARAFDHVGTIGTYVRLDLRRRGIAARLFAATFEAARRKGYEKLFTYVRGDNPAALATYTRQGFTVVGIARGQAKIDGRAVDEVMIERFLGEAR